jgi:integrase
MAFLSPNEIQRLADAIDARYRAMIYTAAYTGLRAGELVGLRLEHLNLLHGQITVSETISEDAKGTLIAGPTKTGKLRTVPIPRALAAMLEEQLAAHPNPSGHVFGAPEGGPLRYHNFRRRFFAPALASAALGRPVRFYDLRHSHAAMLIAQGARAKAIQERLGDSSIRVTLDRYGHILPALEADLVGRLDDTLRQSRVSSACHDTAHDPHPDAPEAPAGASDQELPMERTTGFEPATLTLAR